MPEKKKILIWQWGRYGAGPRLAFELARALKRHCHMDVLLSLAGGAELLETPGCRQLVDFPVKTYGSPGQFMVRTARIGGILAPLVRRLEHERPDVALVVMPSYWDIFLIRHLQRLAIPVVSIIHDAANHPGDSFQAIQWVQRYMIRHSSGIITLTDYIAGNLKKQGYLEQRAHRTMGHPALTFPDLRLPPPQPPGFPRHGALRLLLAGRLRRYKGIDLFLQALPLMDSARLDIRISGVIGDKGLLDQVRNTPQIDVRNNWMSERAFISHIDWADMVVLPYMEASQSGIIPTAYARRRPVVATPVGGLPEQVKHGVTGLLTGEATPQSIAQAVSLCLDAPERVASCAEQAYMLARNDLGWERFSHHLAELLSVQMQI